MGATSVGGAMDSFDRQINQVSDSLREALHGSTWLPFQVEPPPPPPPPKHVEVLSSLSGIQTWVNRHRAWTAAVIAFAGTTIFIVWRSRRAQRQKRRARRAKTGAKVEVVILSGSPYSPLTKTIAIDLERRGFLVYIPVGSLEEEGAIAEMRLADVHPLNFDITSSQSVHYMLRKFSQFLQNPNRHGTTSLQLTSLILLPPHPSPYPIEPAHRLSTQVWSDTLNTHLLYPISVANTFLPLLISQHHRNGSSLPTSLVLVTPSTTSALLLPNHAAESTVSTALTSYFATLRNELPQSISMTHLRLGDLELSRSFSNTVGDTPSSHTQSTSTENSAMVRRLRSNSPDDGLPKMIKSRTTMRELHNSLFDAIEGRTSGTVFVGRGARTYTFVGALAPSALIAWMVGDRKTYDPLKGAHSDVISEASMRGSDGRSRSASGESEQSNGSRGLEGSAEWERVEQGLQGSSIL